MSKPITPEEAVKSKRKDIPDIVIETVNSMLIERLRDGKATIKQDKLVEKLEAVGLNRADIYENGWLDFEDLYRMHGWKVVYDKPAYNEGYRPTFIFSI